MGWGGRLAVGEQEPEAGQSPGPRDSRLAAWQPWSWGGRSCSGASHGKPRCGYSICEVRGSRVYRLRRQRLIN